MPSNTIQFYIGKRFTFDLEAQIKARLRRIAPSRSPAGEMLVPLLVQLDPSAWALILEDAFPDEDSIAQFLTSMIASSPLMLSALKRAVADGTLITEQEAQDHKKRIIEAVESLSELTSTTSLVTEENLDVPGYSEDEIEARLRASLRKP